jgi:hypothetical protein
VISFVLACTVLTVGLLLVDRQFRIRRHLARLGTAWGDSGIRRHRDTGEHPVVPPASAPAAWPTRQTALDHDRLMGLPLRFHHELPTVGMAIDPAEVIRRLSRSVPVQALALPRPPAYGVVRMHSLPSVAEYLAATA